jgi:predicted aspartyl protease
MAGLLLSLKQTPLKTIFSCRSPVRRLMSCVAILSSLAVGACAQAATDDAPHCRYVKLLTLPLSFKEGESRPETEGTINGKPARMLVDTGAYRTSLTRSWIETMGLPLRHLDGYSIGVGGEAAEYGVLLHELSIGAVHGGRNMFKVFDDGTHPMPQNALVGADFLFQRDLEISYAARQLSFFHPQDCDGSFLAYWNPDASVLPFNSMSSEDTVPEFTVEVNGQKLRAMIDTGAWRTVIDVKAAARAGITPDSPGVISMDDSRGVGHHTARTWSAPFDEIALGAETIKHARLIMMDMWGAALRDSPSAETAEWLSQRPEILLGADFLRSHRVLFAMSQRRVYFSYEGGKVFCSQCE